MADAFMHIHRRYLPAVTRFARHIAKSDQDLADDLMQEGWVALLNLPEHRWSEEAYVHTVVCRAMRRWLQRERARAILPAELEQRQIGPELCQTETKVERLGPNVQQTESEVEQIRSRNAA